MNSNLKLLTGSILIAIAGIALTAAIWLGQTHALIATELRKDQEQQLRVFHELLMTRGDEFRAVDGQLLVGDFVLNGQHDLARVMENMFGGVATIFLGDMRIATSLRNEAGNAATGTALAPEIQNALRQAKAFRGESEILGRDYLVALDPLHNRQGEVIGALGVGIDKEDFTASLRKVHLEAVLVSCLLIGIFATLTCLFLRKNLHIRAALAESEAQLRLTQFFVDNAETCIYSISENADILFANRCASHTLGYSREELQGMRIPDLDPYYSADLWPRHWKNLQEKGVLNFETAHRLKDGGLLPVEVTAHYMKFGNVEYNFAFARDISEKKRTDRLLQTEKTILQEIAAGLPLKQILALLCAQIEELSGEGLCSILLRDSDTGHLRHFAGPSLPKAYAKALRRVNIGPGIGSCGTAAFHKSQIISADITSDPHWEGYRDLPLAHGLRACWSTPILSAAGEVYGTFAVYYRMPREPQPFEIQAISHAADLARIVIERHRAAEALRQSEERFRQIFEQNEDAVILLNLHTLELIDANREAERLYGCSRDGLFSLVPWGMLGPGDAPQFIQAISQLPHKGGFHIERLQNTRPDGSTFTVSVWAKVIHLHEDEVLYCSIRDITEKVRIEQEMKTTQAQLIHANKMASLGMLIASVAHEINNPNNCIGVNAAVLDDIWRDACPVLARESGEQGGLELAGVPWPEAEETITQLLAGIARGSQRIAAIINNMREFVSSDGKGLDGAVDLGKVVQDAVQILTPQIHKHTDHFGLSVAENLPAMRGNAQQIEQVVINLLANALQSLPDKKAAVHVQGEFVGERGSLVLRIRDEGRGMDPLTLTRVTEPFFSTRRDAGGTGLGLYISSSIVEAHGGTLEFDSQTGRGTTATLWLPTQPGASQ
ncbi:PAS domain S-box protein [Geoalkalibacter sp.]|uniref:PAS domain S-box protein n=1 Tax=Geoalkalibacter sp. TaxID=3041440 RepID=UPI00272E1CF7|nr:PAS domain S-box protein [Geoalkalibacter sp.]